MNKSIILCVIYACLFNTGFAQNQSKSKQIIDEERMEWWEDARFGMFIHWGLYAQDGCFRNGQDGRSEHMMRNLEIPIAEYKKKAEEFNPERFNADEWVVIAKEAGMKYMVITSKHHDGFAMYNSPSNNYNIVKQTPWKRDPIKELALACQKQGIKFGVYYSLGRDWHHPQCNSKGGRRSNIWDFPDEKNKDYSIYFNEKVKPQITELINQYKPAIIWFDTPELITREQKIPKGGEPQPWETCMTISNVWGYHKKDNNWKSADSLIHSLVDVASKGGNLLLNVGPTGEGIIRESSVLRLNEVGEWLKVNGEAVYGTTSSPVGEFHWGRCTKKIENGNTILYFSVFDWPLNKKLFISQINNKIIESTLLANGNPVKASSSDAGLLIELPDTATDKIARC